MKEIELTKGYKTQVDDDDYTYLTTHFKKFQYSENHKSCYAKTTKVIGGKLRHLMVHTIIMNRHQTVPPGYEIDHIDHNPLNNQRKNLRIVTHQENCENRRIKRNPYCSKCKTNFKYKWYSYCLPCYLEYMRERRKNNPELKKQATEYKREYRRKKKEEIERK